jgi:hypothetical protein
MSAGRGAKPGRTTLALGEAIMRPPLLLLLGIAAFWEMIAGAGRIACGLLVCGEAAVMASGGTTLGLAGAALLLVGGLISRGE